ncbi:MAG: class I adenylate-forming enzyme family protein [Steroidobacteraceae bacterium]
MIKSGMLDTGSALLERVFSIADVVREHATAFPDREALVFHDLRISYRDLDRAANRYADALSAMGVRRGDRVAMLCTPRPEFLLTLLASMRIGSIWVGLNPRYRLREIRHVLEHCRPRILISLIEEGVGRSLAPELAVIRREIADLECLVTIEKAIPGVSESLSSTMPAEPSRRWDSVCIPDREAARTPAVLVYTSGTTGAPKGALLPHSAFLHSYRAMAESFRGQEAIRVGHRIICNLPINHVGCQADLCGNALIDVATLVFMDSFKPNDIPAVIEREKISLLGGLPLMHQQVFDHPQLGAFDLSSLKSVIWGGAPMPRPLLERLMKAGYVLSMHYGLTEGGSINSVSSPEMGIDDFTATVGYPDHDQRYRVISANGDAAVAGQVGEVQIVGAGVMLEYFRDAASTTAAFTADGWLRTGDLVEVRDDGAWCFVGRAGERFKSGGYNVYPREIELVLEEHEDVALAAIVPVPDATYDEVGWAFIVPGPGRLLSESALRNFALTHLANFKIPKRWFFRTELPVLPIGKIDKRALRLEALQVHAADRGVKGEVQH